MHQITKARYWGIGLVTFAKYIHIWSVMELLRREFDQKHAVAVNIFVHEGNHFLITGEVKQSTDCHYILTRSLVCKWYEEKKKGAFRHHNIGSVSKVGLRRPEAWNLTVCPKRHQPGGFGSIKSFKNWHGCRFFFSFFFFNKQVKKLQH